MAVTAEQVFDVYVRLFKQRILPRVLARGFDESLLDRFVTNNRTALLADFEQLAVVINARQQAAAEKDDEVRAAERRAEEAELEAERARVEAERAQVAAERAELRADAAEAAASDATGVDVSTSEEERQRELDEFLWREFRSIIAKMKAAMDADPNLTIEQVIDVVLPLEATEAMYRSRGWMHKYKRESEGMPRPASGPWFHHHKNAWLAKQGRLAEGMPRGRAPSVLLELDNQDKDFVSVYARGRDAVEWARLDRDIEGSRWEFPDGDDPYALINDDAGLLGRLRRDYPGVELDLRYYSPPRERGERLGRRR